MAVGRRKRHESSIEPLRPPRRHPVQRSPYGGRMFLLANWCNRPHMRCSSTDRFDSRRRKGRPVVLRLATERACQMFTAQQYRAKAAEFRSFLANAPRSPNETSEFRDLEQTYTTLAENEEWMAVHIDQTIQERRQPYGARRGGGANLEMPGRGGAHALGYGSHEASTGALRLRQCHR
jgi:hypothetical protein